MILFVDSSSFIQVGLLNKEFNWEHYELIKNKKGSHIIHSAIHEALSLKNLKTRDLEGIILANGPGSYTGIRVAEGLCQVLELEGLKVASFYHFEAPMMCGVEKYHYVSQAFKGEVFLYQRDGESESFNLISEEEFCAMDLNPEATYSLEGELIGQSHKKLYDLYSERTPDIFNKVLLRGQHNPPYYYRSVEKEFKLPQK
jgi:tRNA threonylcarbamoyladenosine biosynthesis protein TsaB